MNGILIAPFWNWNQAKSLQKYSWLYILIAPFWNWNNTSLYNPKDRSPHFNRTILELKRFYLLQRLIHVQHFNRTILELKPRYVPGNPPQTGYFNRTILELKRWNSFSIFSLPKILIAPFWNWNNVYSIKFGDVLPNFNRTILELKLGID